jgi:hypothetical protein
MLTFGGPPFGPHHALDVTYPLPGIGTIIFHDTSAEIAFNDGTIKTIKRGCHFRDERLSSEALIYPYWFVGLSELNKLMSTWHSP